MQTARDLKLELLEIDRMLDHEMDKNMRRKYNRRREKILLGIKGMDPRRDIGIHSGAVPAHLRDQFKLRKTVVNLKKLLEEVK